jgi:Calcineurin-like phosphoesterase/NUDIX domain
MNILHLSDLHFRTLEDADTWYHLLSEDLFNELDCKEINALIVSGDIANTAQEHEYEAAKAFLKQLMNEFKLETNNIVIVPGNHDVDWGVAKSSYTLMRRAECKTPLDSPDIYDDEKCEHIEVCTDPESYRARFEKFSAFYRSVKGWPYPLEYGNQHEFHFFKEQGVLIVGLNSAWQTDHNFPGRASIHPHALNQVLFKMRGNPEFRGSVKLAVWHHPLQSSGEDRIKDHGFAERLVAAGFCIGLHGHVHQTDAHDFNYEVGPSGRKAKIITAGTFGAPTRELVTGTPWQYNFMRMNGRKIIVETRARNGINTPWRAYGQWHRAKGAPSSKYEITLSKPQARQPSAAEPLKTRAQLNAYFKREAYNTEGYRIAVEAHIFDAKGRILLQERGVKARDEVGKLEGIGGELRDEADLHETLQDKIKKELGDKVVVRIDDLLEIRPVRFIENGKGPQDWFIVSYLCRLVSGEPVSPDTSVVATLHFFTLQELYDIPDEELSRSTSRARILYKARYGNIPYYDARKTE